MKKFVFCLQIVLFPLLMRAQEQYLLPEFTPGTIYYKEGAVVKASMNYNLLTDRMLMIDGDKKKSVFSDEIEYVGLGILKFVLLENDFGEIKFDGDKAVLAIKHGAKVKTEDGAKGLSKDKLNKQMEANGPIPDGVSIVRDSVFYLVKQKTHTQRFYLAENMIEKANYRGFLKVFSKHSVKLNEYIKEEDINFGKLDDLCKLLIFCENLE